LSKKGGETLAGKITHCVAVNRAKKKLCVRTKLRNDTPPVQGEVPPRGRINLRRLPTNGSKVMGDTLSLGMVMGSPLLMRYATTLCRQVWGNFFTRFSDETVPLVMTCSQGFWGS